MKKTYFILTIFMLGCSSSSVGTKATGGKAGMAGFAGEAGFAGMAGNAGQGGFGNEAGLGGKSGAGSTGGATGGSSGAGGNTGGVSGSSGTNTGGTGGACVPKTCDTFSFNETGNVGLACGPVQDGCGNVLDCGGCKDPNFTCGEAAPNSDGSKGIGKPGICGGGCTITNLPGCGLPAPYKYTICASNYQELPFPGCVPTTSLPTTTWCCY